MSGSPKPMIVDQSGGGDFRTINAAIRNAKPNSVLSVRPGTYRESIKLSTGIEIVADGPVGSVILETTDVVAIDVASGAPRFRGVVIRSNSENDDFVEIGYTRDPVAVRVQSGTPYFDACTISARHGAGVLLEGKDANAQFHACRIHECQTNGIDCISESRGTFDNCDVASNKGCGIEVVNWADPVLKNCTIRDGLSHGVRIGSEGKGTFESCTIVRNNGCGIIVRKNGDPVVRSCIIRDWTTRGIYVTTYGKGTFESCELIGTTGPAWVVEPRARGVRRNNRPEAPR